MGIKPIKRVHVGEQVFEQLKQLLIDGEWRQGEKLPSENSLAEMLGVSRITVRQALQKLGALGLIETRLGEGSFVKVIDISDSMRPLLPAVYLSGNEIEQVFEFRQIIDVESIRLAVARCSKEDIEELKKIHRKMMRKKDEADAAGFAKMDTEFHFKISQITGNSLIIKTNEILRDVINSYVTVIIKKMGQDTALEYHGKILEAMEAGDEKSAIELMRKHLTNNVKYIDEIKSESASGTKKELMQ